MAKGTQENHQDMEDSDEHCANPCFLSHQPASPLPGSIHFLLPLSFKPTPYSGSESEVGQLLRGIWKGEWCFGCISAWGSTLLPFTWRWLGPKDAQHTQQDLGPYTIKSHPETNAAVEKHFFRLGVSERQGHILFYFIHSFI